MNTLEMRERVKGYIDQLSAKKLLVAADFLAYLAEREDSEATEELFNIQGFREAFTEAQKSVEQGRVISIEQLKRKY